MLSASQNKKMLYYVSQNSIPVLSTLAVVTCEKTRFDFCADLLQKFIWGDFKILNNQLFLQVHWYRD